MVRESRPSIFASVLVRLALAAAASLVVVFVADYALFELGTWGAWQLDNDHTLETDRTWWRSQVGDIPSAIGVPAVYGPPGMRGRPGNWYHGRGGPGSSGGRGTATGPGVPDIYSYDVIGPSPLIGGRAYTSATGQCAYRVGVAMPRTMIERYWVGTVTAGPPHPKAGGWSSRVKPMALAVNLLPAMLLVAVAWLTFLLVGGAWRATRRIVRVRRGHCPSCAYPMGSSIVCTECGAPRPPHIATDTSLSPSNGP